MHLHLGLSLLLALEVGDLFLERPKLHGGPCELRERGGERGVGWELCAADRAAHFGDDPTPKEVHRGEAVPTQQLSAAEVRVVGIHPHLRGVLKPGLADRLHADTVLFLWHRFNKPSALDDKLALVAHKPLPP